MKKRDNSEPVAVMCVLRKYGCDYIRINIQASPLLKAWILYNKNKNAFYKRTLIKCQILVWSLKQKGSLKRLTEGKDAVESGGEQGSGRWDCG